MIAGMIVALFGGNIVGSALLPLVIILLFTAMFLGHKIRSTSFVSLFTVAILIRILFLFFPESDDLYRYIWEGIIQNSGFNPFALAPNASELELFRPWFHSGINHPDIPAIYWPVAQLLFRAVTTFSTSPMVMKLVMVLFDLGTLALLYRMLPVHQRGKLSFWVFNPVVLFGVAGEGHLEIIPVFFTLLALFLFNNKRYAFMYIALALAVMTKVNFLLFLPLFITKKSTRSLIFTAIPLLLFIPYVESGVNPLTVPFQFGSGLAWNGPLFSAVTQLIHWNWSYPVILLTLGFGSILIYCITANRTALIFVIAGLFLVTTPTLHYWYLLMITPFLILYLGENRSVLSGWMILHGTIFFTGFFFHSNSEGFWKNLLLIQFLAFVPPSIVGLIGLLKKSDTRIYPDQTGENLSIVLPVLNESERIQQRITELSKLVPNAEIVVVDGGSSDDTYETVENMNVILQRSDRGRGLQIAKGVSQSSRDIVVILHADTTPSETIFSRIESLMSDQSSLVGGSCGQRFDSDKNALSLIQMLNTIRASIFGISFGDQTQFFRRELFVDSFPEYHLMEDVELSMRMKEKGEIIYLPNGVTVSSRGWEKRGYVNNIKIVVTLLTQFLLLRQFQAISDNCESFYHRYYGK